MHSWRALLLPFLDQRRLAGLYNFNEPWDSAANLPLLKEIPDVFASQGDRTKGSGTGFVVVVGEGTAFPTAGAAGVEAFGEPLTSHNLALIVAVERSGIGWTEPRDAELDVRSLPPRISLASDDLLSHLDIPVVAGFADGSARPIGDGLPRDAFAKYFTLSRNGH